jgi:hypothetical protein
MKATASDNLTGSFVALWQQRAVAIVEGMD